MSFVFSSKNIFYLHLISFHSSNSDHIIILFSSLHPCGSTPIRGTRRYCYVSAWISGGCCFIASCSGLYVGRPAWVTWAGMLTTYGMVLSYQQSSSLFPLVCNGLFSVFFDQFFDMRCFQSFAWCGFLQQIIRTTFLMQRQFKFLELRYSHYTLRIFNELFKFHEPKRITSLRVITNSWQSF